MDGWVPIIEYDEGRLGKSIIFGIKTREEAIAWLTRAFDWNLCWYLLPSCRLITRDQYNKETSDNRLS